MAVAAQSGIVDFVQVSGASQMLSGLAATLDRGRVERDVQIDGSEMQTIKVSTERLMEIIGRAGLSEIHYLSMDIEGGEAAVLSACDFGSVMVHAMTIECNSREAQARVVKAVGKQFISVGQLHWDHFFVNRDSHFAAGIKSVRQEIQQIMKAADRDKRMGQWRVRRNYLLAQFMTALWPLRKVKRALTTLLGR